MEKFESIKYLDKCIECLDQAQTTSPKAMESIKLQRSHHIKQRDLILHHYEKYKKTEKQKLEIVNVQFNERVINSNKISQDLFENIDSTDTLLEELKKTIPDSQSAIELQRMNSRLNVLLYQLITHHDETIQENDSLKEKLKTIEMDGKSKLNEKRSDFRAIDDVKDVSRLSPETVEVQEEFAPLDLPVFDLESLDAPKN
jgi:hypothetical protein